MYINNFSDFNLLKKYYKKNNQKEWNKWLQYDESIRKNGKQGLVGFFNTVEETKSNKRIVYKISQYINYLIQHEYTVMNGLNELSSYCPHYCKAIGTILCEMNPVTEKNKNPFSIESRHPIEKEVLLMEEIEDSIKLSKHIKKVKKTNSNVIYSAIKQVLIAITIAQKKKNFTHYDLHSDNIMMKKCNDDDVFLYIIDDNNQYCIPTFGYYPIIIDFGFSYIKDLENGPAWPSMGHTDVGFLSNRYDSITDSKLFLVTVASELKEYRNGKKSVKFQNIVKNIFKNLKIEWDSGWDKGYKKSASDYVTDMIHGYGIKSHIFNEYNHYCMDIIQTLIILPLEEHKYDDIEKSYEIFINEFVKIENEIGSPYYNLYILKGIVDIAREVRSDYIKGEECKIHALNYFKNNVYNRINLVADFCNPKNIHFEKLLCSLLCFSRKMEGVLYDVISSRIFDKEKKYKKLPLKNSQHIYGSIEVNIPDNYIFNKNTNVHVFDMINETTSKLNLSNNDILDINNSHNLNKGKILYKLYNLK